MLFTSAIIKAQGVEGYVIDAETDKPFKGAEVFVVNSDRQTTTDANGHYTLSLSSGTYTIAVYQPNYKTVHKQITITTGIEMLYFRLYPFEELLEEVQAIGRQSAFDVSRLKSVEGTLIYEGKKNEVIELDKLNGNLATNNARQAFAKVPGLNIWESDAAGLQLGVGGRGLNPNRTSNFNTRQNGYDISADPLGYPESYYAPPLESLSKIEVVRGAASLQYGTQFGGMINFLFKKGEGRKPFTFNTRNTVGSFGLFSSYNSVSGDLGKLDYFAFYQRKQGNGWRENESFESNTAFADVNVHLSDQLFLCFEFTHMDYLARQAGGLTDALFEQNPRQSLRDRNWFAINWNIPAVILEYKASNNTTLNLKTFGLFGSRKALGNLEAVTRLDDPETNRNLLWDEYRNFGTEFRTLHRYKLFDQIQALAAGFRYFQGNTQQQQGLGTSGYDADFHYINPDNLEDLSFQYPSRNVAFFAENIFNISEKLSITPGLRWEYINTQSDGYYRASIPDLAGNILYDTTFYEQNTSIRSFLLAGVGLSYKQSDHIELYSNLSQNYRAINFNDLRVNNSNLVVDPNMTDERGYNLDIGMRGSWSDILNYDWSAFYLRYNDRIGGIWTKRQDSLGVTKTYRLRTNISDAYVVGIETYTEWNISNTIWKEPTHIFSLFANAAFIEARYLKNNAELSENVGDFVESVPKLNVKTGLNYAFNNFSSTFQFTYVSDQYSEASNAENTPSGIDGLIPAYYVMDFSLKYTHKFAQLEAGINNLTNSSYFTRRATGYPGPGIIPSSGRNYYVTLGLTF